MGRFGAKIEALFVPYAKYAILDPMSKDTIIMALGAFVAVLPFLGFPSSWDVVLLVLSGVALIAVGIVIRRAKKPHQRIGENMRLFSDQEKSNTHHREHEES